MPLPPIIEAVRASNREESGGFGSVQARTSWFDAYTHLNGCSILVANWDLNPWVGPPPTMQFGMVRPSLVDIGYEVSDMKIITTVYYLQPHTLQILKLVSNRNHNKLSSRSARKRPTFNNHK